MKICYTSDLSYLMPPSGPDKPKDFKAPDPPAEKQGPPEANATEFFPATDALKAVLEQGRAPDTVRGEVTSVEKQISQFPRMSAEALREMLNELLKRTSDSPLPDRILHALHRERESLRAQGTDLETELISLRKNHKSKKGLLLQKERAVEGAFFAYQKREGDLVRLARAVKKYKERREKWRTTPPNHKIRFSIAQWHLGRASKNLPSAFVEHEAYVAVDTKGQRQVRFFDGSKGRAQQQAIRHKEHILQQKEEQFVTLEQKIVLITNFLKGLHG